MKKEPIKRPSSEALPDLTEEFETLRSLILQDEAAEGDDVMLAVARLFPGMTLDQWSEIADSHGLKDWIALALDKSSAVSLSHLQKALEELAHQTEHDPLTGVANRRALERKLEIELQRVERSGGQLSMAIIDLDDFKIVNDTYGHPCGDEVLIQLANVLEDSKRAYDVAARMGGEEFALILPGAAPLKAKAMVERILAEFSAFPFTCGESRFTCTFSAGVASIKGRSNSTIDDLIALADKALYEAKNSGKNQVHVSRMRLEAEIDRTTMVHSNEKQFLFGGLD